MKLRKPVVAVMVDWNSLQTAYQKDEELTTRIAAFERDVDDMRVHIEDLRVARHLLKVAQDAVAKSGLVK